MTMIPRIEAKRGRRKSRLLRKKPLYFQIIDQGFVITASELDACTALAAFAGNDTKIARGREQFIFIGQNPGSALAS
jgi:hypothetical protein